MFVHTVQLVAVRHRRVGVFFAPDPAHESAADTEFNIETYRMMPRGTTVVRPGLATAGGHDRFAIKSEIDGEPRFLPDAIAALWHRGEIPAEALPELHFRLAPEFSRPRDFEPLLARRARHRWFGFITLGACALLTLVFWWTVFGPGEALFSPKNRFEFLDTTGPEWLAEPVRPDVFITTTDSVQALATVPLDATGYAPPAARFDVPPPNPSHRPGYTLARIQAADEQRLVLVSEYERTLLPRVFLNGAVISADDLGLPNAELEKAAAGAQTLNTEFVLCNHVMPREKAWASKTVELALWLVIIFGTVLLFPLAIVSFLLWRRQVKRQRQLDSLRQRLGLRA